MIKDQFQNSRVSYYPLDKATGLGDRPLTVAYQGGVDQTSNIAHLSNLWPTGQGYYTHRHPSWVGLGLPVLSGHLWLQLIKFPI